MSFKIDQEQKGAVSLIVLTFIYGMYGVFSRFISIEFGAFSQNAVKNIIVSILACLIVAFLGVWVKIRKKDLLLFVVWGFMSFISIVTTFISYNHSSIATTLLIFYASSILCVYITGALIFKEKMNKLKYISLILGAIGLFIVSSNNISFTEPYYLFLSFISGVTAALWYSISKILSRRYSVQQLIYIDSLFNLIFSFSAVIFLKEIIPSISLSASWIFLVLYAIAQLTAEFLSIYGYKHLEVQKAALITPMDIIFSSIFAYLVFNEGISVSTLIGGIIILIALVLPNLFWKKKTIYNLKKSPK